MLPLIFSSWCKELVILVVWTFYLDLHWDCFGPVSSNCCLTANVSDVCTPFSNCVSYLLSATRMWVAKVHFNTKLYPTLNILLSRYLKLSDCLCFELSMRRHRKLQPSWQLSSVDLPICVSPIMWVAASKFANIDEVSFCFPPPATCCWWRCMALTKPDCWPGLTPIIVTIVTTIVRSDRQRWAGCRTPRGSQLTVTGVSRSHCVRQDTRQYTTLWARTLYQHCQRVNTVKWQIITDATYIRAQDDDSNGGEK